MAAKNPIEELCERCDNTLNDADETSSIVEAVAVVMAGLMTPEQWEAFERHERIVAMGKKYPWLFTKVVTVVQPFWLAQ